MKQFKCLKNCYKTYESKNKHKYASDHKYVSPLILRRPPENPLIDVEHADLVVALAGHHPPAHVTHPLVRIVHKHLHKFAKYLHKHLHKVAKYLH